MSLGTLPDDPATALLLRDIPLDPVRFQTAEEARARIEAACAARPDVARFHVLGESEEGRPLYGCEIGTGPCTVSLIAGAHADEPVGPETLRRLAVGLLEPGSGMAALLGTYRFLILPHINPDGEARNRPWMRVWPDAAAYIRDVVRELPGRDLEFGFPDMRVENRLVAGWLRRAAPFSLHASLHGMGFSEGAMLLIERSWVERTEELRNGFVRVVREAGWPLHAHDRGGEKGFRFIAPGFTTTPRGDAMRAHFLGQGQPEVAARFHHSSMDMVQGWSGDPLCLVTELPLFLVPPVNQNARWAVPEAYLAFKDALPGLKERLLTGRPVQEDLEAFGVRPLPLADAMRVQLHALALGLATVARQDAHPGR